MCGQERWSEEVTCSLHLLGLAGIKNAPQERFNQSSNQSQRFSLKQPRYPAQWIFQECHLQHFDTSPSQRRMATTWKKQVNRFCYQYLQLESTPTLPDQELLRLEQVQDALYRNLFEDGSLQCQPPVRYRLRILKRLVADIEASIDDWNQHGLSDDLASALATLLCEPLPPEASTVQQKCYVTYYLSKLAGEASASADHVSLNHPHITLLESRSLISAGGTTGLRTWEASLHLGQYLCRSPDIIHGKRVLELGAGTGYLSILCANFLGAAHVIASDGSEEVINNLPENLFLNDLQDQSTEKVRPMEIRWGHALLGTEEQAWNGGRPLDVVFGADVTYDKSVIPALTGTILELFDLYPAVEVYISATQRNEETFQVFLDRCQRSKLLVFDMDFPVPSREIQTGPFYSDSVSIRICRVSKPLSTE